MLRRTLQRYRRELTPLFKAAYDGQVQAARGLLAGRGGRGGVEVDRVFADDGTTPLLQASARGVVGVAKLLLDHRTDPNKPSQGRRHDSLAARGREGLRRRGQAPPGARGQKKTA